MKKIAFLLLVIVFAYSGNAQTTKTKFYYYPSSNVYYNSASGKYIYNNNGNWVIAKTLPHGIAIANSRRVIVYHSSAQVWENNTEHRTKYKPTKLPPGQLKKKAISRSH
jgi:hypothetical protein